MKRQRTTTKHVVKRQRKTGPVSFKAAVRKAQAVKDFGYVDTLVSTSASGVDTTGVIEFINPISQGAGVNERVGKKAVLKSLQCRGYFSNGTGDNKNAIIIVYDKKPREAVPAITDILETSSSLSMNNDASSSRYSILKRIDWASTLEGGGSENGKVKSIDFFLDLKGLLVEYNDGTSGAITSIEEGAMYCIIIGNVAPGAGPGDAELNFRTRFLDV